MVIGMIGLGYVGLTLAVAAAAKGIQVYGVETNTHIKECLKESHAHFYEPGLDQLIRRHNHKTLHVVEEFPEGVYYYGRDAAAGRGENAEFCIHPIGTFVGAACI